MSAPPTHLASARTERRARGLALAFVLGLLLRLLALPLPGTLDISIWKIWAAMSTSASGRRFPMTRRSPRR